MVRHTSQRRRYIIVERCTDSGRKRTPCLVGGDNRWCNRCPWPWRRTPPRTVSTLSVKERAKWSAVAPSPRAACFAARSALSLPGTPTWEGTHCKTMSMPRVISWWHTTTISLTTSSLEDWLLCLMARSADSESEKNRHRHRRLTQVIKEV